MATVAPNDPLAVQPQVQVWAAAPRSEGQGPVTIAWLTTLPTSGPSGGFFRARKPIPW